MKPYLVLLIIALSIGACVEPPDYSVTPEIEFVSMNKDTILQGSTGVRDELRVTFSFRDGDGDLGFVDSEERPILITDTRDSSSFLIFQFDPLPELGAGNGISGEITILLKSESGICCITEEGNNGCDLITPEMPIDTVTYKIQLIDRAGNESNVIETPNIIIKCE